MTEFLTFDFIQAQIDIGFDQLIKLAKQLPKSQWTKLKTKVEEQEQPDTETPSDMLSFLMSAPTFTKKQLVANKMVLVDTSVFIDFFRKTDKYQLFIIPS